jgi:hypothetical protein
MQDIEWEYSSDGNTWLGWNMIERDGEGIMYVWNASYLEEI